MTGNCVHVIYGGLKDSGHLKTQKSWRTCNTVWDNISGKHGMDITKMSKIGNYYTQFMQMRDCESNL
jgi:hypothetical protein